MRAVDQKPEYHLEWPYINTGAIESAILASQPFLGVRDWWIAYLRVVPVEF